MPGTLAVTGAQTIGGNLTVTGTLTASSGVTGAITSGTAVTASGTSVNFTGIPAGVKRITVMFSGVSTNGTSLSQVQIGSGSVTTSGYNSTASYGITNSTNFAYVSTGFVLNTTGTSSASVTFSGILQICLIGSNVWAGTGSSGGNATNQVTNSLAGSSPALGGALDRIRITTVNGTDTFDAGSINILYE
jgi:hypothetical protein